MSSEEAMLTYVKTLKEIIKKDREEDKEEDVFMSEGEEEEEKNTEKVIFFNGKNKGKVIDREDLE